MTIYLLCDKSQQKYLTAKGEYVTRKLIAEAFVTASLDAAKAAAIKAKNPNLRIEEYRLGTPASYPDYALPVVESQAN